MNVFDEFQWRGMVYDATEGLAELLAKESVTAYIGFDPTASSLHVGNLLTLMGLARLQRFGHSPIAIVGGGTGMIGDPSGKSQERVLLSAAQIEEKQNRKTEAQSDYREAITLYGKSIGADHPEALHAQELYTRFVKKMRK